MTPLDASRLKEGTLKNGTNPFTDILKLPLLITLLSSMVD